MYRKLIATIGRIGIFIGVFIYIYRNNTFHLTGRKRIQETVKQTCLALGIVLEVFFGGPAQVVAKTDLNATQSQFQKTPVVTLSDMRGGSNSKQETVDSKPGSSNLFLNTPRNSNSNTKKLDSKPSKKPGWVTLKRNSDPKVQPQFPTGLKGAASKGSNYQDDRYEVVDAMTGAGKRASKKVRRDRDQRQQLDRTRKQLELPSFHLSEKVEKLGGTKNLRFARTGSGARIIFRLDKRDPNKTIVQILGEFSHDDFNKMGRNLFHDIRPGDEF